MKIISRGIRSISNQISQNRVGYLFLVLNLCSSISTYLLYLIIFRSKDKLEGKEKEDESEREAVSV